MQAPKKRPAPGARAPRERAAPVRVAVGVGPGTGLGRRRRAGAAGAELTEFEREMVELFVNFAQLVGVPKSVGEIFGLLFASSAPLPFDAVVRKLSLSKGSASQGLRYLRGMDVVRTVYRAGDRRDHYLARDQLRPLIAAFLNERLQPYLAGGRDRLARLGELLPETAAGGGGGEDDGGGIGSTDVLRTRVDRLAGWAEKAEVLLPLLLGLLGGTGGAGPGGGGGGSGTGGRGDPGAP